MQSVKLIQIIIAIISFNGLRSSENESGSDFHLDNFEVAEEELLLELLQIYDFHIVANTFQVKVYKL